MKIIQADRNDILELYRLQLLAFESEAEMIGSRDVPALQEAEEENARDFSSQINIRLYEKMGYKSIKNIQKKVKKKTEKKKKQRKKQGIQKKKN